MALIQILHRRDTAANWTSANPVLGAGELGLDTTAMRVKLGDGATAWNSLAYQTTVVHSTNGLPSNTVGVNGDFAFDVPNKTWYGPKAGGVWPAGVSLQGPQGIQGNTGTTGAGVPTGGTAGQYLRKTSGTDYATAWSAIPTSEVTGLDAALTAKFDKLNGTLTGVASPTYAAGKLVYDLDNDSLTFYNSDNQVALQVGQEQWIRVRNVSGSTINNGQAVYVNGASTGLPTIGLARANSAATAASVGLATENIANNATGFVTTQGVVRGLNTSGFTAGAVVYLSETTAGGLTATRPQSPNLSQRIGVVAVSDATNGLIYVSPVGTGASMYYDIVAHGGADYTGTVDATSIIQSAVNLVGAAGGGIVWIPIGSFKTSATITISNPFVTIMGASRVKSKIVPTHATGDVFQAAAAAIFTRFESFRIEPASSTLRTNDYGINVVAGASNCSIQWVDILFMWSAIKATGQLCRIEDVNLRECGYGAANGCVILIDSFTDQYIRAVVADNGTVAPNAPQTGFSGVRITNLSSLIMADCQIIHCGYGMDLSPASTNTIPSIKCSNVFFDQGIVGLRANPGSGSILRTTFVGCWFSGNSTAGALLNGTAINGLDFIACEFYGAPSQPVGIDAVAATEWSVRASRIAGNSVAGIRTTAGANHSFSITDNVIGSVGGVSANGLGINIQAGAYNRYQILDNRGLDTNTTPGITDNGTTSYSIQKNVDNNMGAGMISGVAVRLVPPVTIPSLLTTEQVAITLPIPANAVVPGTTFRIRLRGQTNAASTITGRLKVGAAAGIGTNTVVLLTTSAAQAANAWFTMDFDATIATVGAGGTISGGGNAQFQAVPIGITSAAYTPASVATNAPWWLTVTLAQGTTAGAITLRHGTIIVDAVN